MPNFLFDVLLLNWLTYDPGGTACSDVVAVSESFATFDASSTHTELLSWKVAVEIDTSAIHFFNFRSHLNA